MRFEIEPEYVLEEGCRCMSCWERTGRWKVVDMEDRLADVYFDTEESATAWVRQWMDKRNYETHTKDSKISQQNINGSNY